MPRRVSSDNGNPWRRVVFGVEVGDDGECPQCGGEYSECPCPGPTMDDYDYKVIDNLLMARPKKNPAG